MQNTDSNLVVTNEISETFKCSLERAFKTPILGDATMILIAPGNIPFVKGFVKDDTWGITGGSRVPLIPLIGEFGIDKIYTRDENKYWKWGVSEMGIYLFFAKEALGEWWSTDNLDGTITVKWRYTYSSRNIFTYPFTWLYVRLFWRLVMKNGMKSIKNMAETETPYIYQ